MEPEKEKTRPCLNFEIANEVQSIAANVWSMNVACVNCRDTVERWTLIPLLTILLILEQVMMPLLTTALLPGSFINRCVVRSVALCILSAMYRNSNPLVPRTTEGPSLSLQQQTLMTKDR